MRSRVLASTISGAVLVGSIGPAFAGRLAAGGITTFAALAASTPDALAELVQAPDWRRPDYANWIEQARALAS